jgi:hypothetical protein
MLFGTDIDYEAMAKDPALACSFEEVWNLHASIYHENLTEEQMTEIKETVKENPGLEGTTEGGTGEASSVCCKLFVAEVNGEVDIKKAGKDNYQPVEKGTEIEVGDEIVTGDGSSVVIAKVCTDSPDLASIALVSENTLWRLESIEGGMANVYIDPGVAQVSVKQLEQFETDFQVSTPRLTCATRG